MLFNFIHSVRACVRACVCVCVWVWVYVWVCVCECVRLVHNRKVRKNVPSHWVRLHSSPVLLPTARVNVFVETILIFAKIRQLNNKYLTT